jgi:hypothetical protein
MIPSAEIDDRVMIWHRYDPYSDCFVFTAQQHGVYLLTPTGRRERRDDDKHYKNTVVYRITYLPFDREREVEAIGEGREAVATAKLMGHHIETVRRRSQAIPCPSD